MNKFNFMHISPTAHLDDFCKNQTHHLLLAHLLETDTQYYEWYRNNKSKNPNHVYILDNSAFELYKRGLPMFEPSKMVDLAKGVKADYIVLPDYPAEHSSKTIQAAQKWALFYQASGFKTFFVPQSEIRDLSQYIQCLQWGCAYRLIDYIGISILAVPNAYGVEKDNKLQRFLSRWKLWQDYRVYTAIDQFKLSGGRVHFLGMTDGPNELELLAPYLGIQIDSWDSSAAVWAGLNNILFDTSPTGLINGKFETHVDFDFYTPDQKLIGYAKSNCQYINKIVEDINEI